MTASSSITFKINGVTLALSAQEVRTRLSAAEPEPLREHAVQVDGTLYPAKQAFALATGLDRLDFTTNQARAQLRKLGFPLIRVSNAP